MPSKKYTMPDRSPRDGQATVHRGNTEQDYNDLYIEVTTDGKTESVRMTDYNAWRIFGMMSLLLELPLSKNIAKAIHFGDGPGSMTFGPSKPLETIGDKLAWNLTKQLMEKVLDDSFELRTDYRYSCTCGRCKSCMGM